MRKAHTITSQIDIPVFIMSFYKTHTSVELVRVLRKIELLHSLVKRKYFKEKKINF